jgi:hypothetical protein
MAHEENVFHPGVDVEAVATMAVMKQSVQR